MTNLETAEANWIKQADTKKLVKEKTIIKKLTLNPKKI